MATYKYGRAAHNFARRLIRSNQLHFKEMLKEKILKRDDVEFYAFIMIGFGDGWSSEWRKKVEHVPNQPMNMYDFTDTAPYVCSAEVLGKTREEVETRYNQILLKTMEYHNQKVEMLREGHN